jgi:[CysO sulfur-carrier protein]-S-L-cysteine hydrolase
VSDLSTPLNLPGAMRDEIVAHARQEWPRECCGLIAGVNGEAKELRRVTNTDPGTTFYNMDPKELFRAYRDFDERGWDIHVIYHSHPVSVAFPSKTDISLAAWPDAYYLICSLEDKENPSLRSFRIVDGAVTEVDVVGKG